MRALPRGSSLFTIDTLFIKNKQRFPLYVVAFIISIVCNNILNNSETNIRVTLFILGLYISSFLIAIYKISKQEKDFHKYILQVFNSNIILSIASFVLQMGLIFTTLVMDELLFSNIELDLFLRGEILFLGLFGIPCELLCLINNKKDVLKPIKFLVCYIMLPIVLFLIVIIYIYFFKILIIRNIPSNQIFAIITSLFTISFPTWIMIENYKNENKIIKLNTKIIPYSFILLICMQMYSIGIRIYEMGFTIERYLGVIFIIFEIAAIILTIIKNNNYLNKIVLVGICLIITTMCIPKTNVIDVSCQSQLKRILSIYKKGTNYETLTDKEKNIIKSSYEYIKYSLDNEEIIPEYIDKEKIMKYNYINNYNNYAEISFQNSIKEINVEGFKSALEANTYESSYRELISIDKLELDYLNIYEDNNINMQIKNSFRKYINNIINNNKVDDTLIKLDDNNYYWLKYVYISYDVDSKNIKDIIINGYLLKK